MRLCTKDFSGSYVKANQVHLTVKLTRVRVTGIKTQNQKTSLFARSLFEKVLNNGSLA